MWYTLLFLLLGLLTACSESLPTPTPVAPPTEGVFVLCQGNMYDGIAGSLDCLTPGDGYHRGVFAAANGGMPLGDTPVAACRCGSRLYVAAYASGVVWALDAASCTSLGRVSVPSPEALATDGKHIFVACNDGYVALLDTATLTVTQRVPVGPNPAGLVVVGDALYCSISDGYNYEGGYADGYRVVRLRTSTLAPDGDFRVGMNPTALAADAAGNVYCVASGDYGATPPEVWRITPNGEVARYCAGSIIATAPEVLYVIDAITDWTTYTTTLSYRAYDTATAQPLADFRIDRAAQPVSPIAMTYDATRRRLYITSDAALYDFNSPGTLHVFSPQGAPIATYETGTHPYAIVP